jgi:inner membrane transporter RhtA
VPRSRQLPPWQPRCSPPSVRWQQEPFGFFPAPWSCSRAITTLITRRVADQTDGHDGLALSIAVAALLTLPVGLPAALGGPELGDLGLVAAVGVLGIALPYALEFDALRRVGVKTYSILLSLDPAVAGLAGLVLLGQHLSPFELLGIALAMGASVGAVASRPAG